MLKQLAILGIIATAAIGATQTVEYNGAALAWDSDRPYNNRGTVMLPARDTMARISGSLDRNENGNRLTLRWFDNTVDYRKGDSSFRLNGRDVRLDGRSEERSGVLYLPFEIFRKITNNQLRVRGGNQDGGRPDRPDYGNADQAYFDGRRINPSGDNQSYMKGGTLMVSFREFGSQIGARTDRTEDGKRVWIYFGGDRVEYNKGMSWYRFNQDQRNVKTISEERNGVLFVPVELYIAATRGRVKLR
ncbi:hypothetical protein BH11ARM1_BH11ARM1_15010 [soil metagenome]